VALVLIGFMGAGKSTLAGRLARARGTVARDSDALLAARFGHSVAIEFELHGEPAFREAEEQVIGGLLAEAGPREVIALGGGSVLSKRTRDALAGHLVALVDVDVELAWDRVQAENEGSDRPLARDRDAFGVLYDERRELYEEVADARLLWAESASGSYPVLVGSGLLGSDRDRESAGETAASPAANARTLLSAWPLDPASSRPYLVADTTVAGLYGERLAGLGAGASDSPSVVSRTSSQIAIEAGEEHKTLAGAEHVWRELASQEMTRADHVVALGGGVVGDLAGFCAATYQRGVPVVHVPTTLVAQVDSAYGGKTGVDLPDAKNYVGAYHQPAGVIVDPDTLETLPDAELASGWVEVLKTALIAGGSLWERVSRMEGCQVDEATIRDCAATKLEVVREDERDGGRRQVLNLGHTVGHAIETATAYRRYRHGEAVGLGLLAALRLSGAAELRDQVKQMLAARGLPVSLDGRSGNDPGLAVDPDAILLATSLDKKRIGRESVPFVLAHAPGEVEIGQQVAETELKAAVTELMPS
jgi:shikimate kinase / 3-dehydroquinate synthase